MVLTFEAHQWFFMILPGSVWSGGLCRNCDLRSVHVGRNGLKDCLCICVCFSMSVCLWGMSVWERARAGENGRVFVCMRLWEFHFLLWTLLGSTHWPERLFLHQFMMQFLFNVMKYTWLLPPDRTDAKNTWGTAQTHKDMYVFKFSCY